MIRRKIDKGWFLFTQDDHAKLSSQIMSFWGGGGFFFPRPCDDLLFALSEHDCGWKKADSSPILNSNGEPEDFTEVSLPGQYEIWRQSFGKHVDTRPDACVLVALHFNKFNERTLSRRHNKWSLSLKKEIERFVTETQGIKSVEKIPSDTAKNLKLLQTGDALSLALCHGWDSFEIDDVPLENGKSCVLRLKMVGENSCSVNPWPFSHKRRLSFEINFMTVSGEKFDSNKRLLESISHGRKMKVSLLPEKFQG